MATNKFTVAPARVWYQQCAPMAMAPAAGKSPLLPMATTTGPQFAKPREVNAMPLPAMSVAGYAAPAPVSPQAATAFNEAGAQAPRLLWWLKNRASEVRFLWALAFVLPLYYVMMPAAAHAAGFAGLPASAFAAYQHQLSVRPFLANACTSGVIYTLGDVVSQKGEGVKSLNTNRCLRSTIAGFLGHGPCGTLWHKISQTFYLKWGLTQWWSVIPKVAIDQLVYCPIWVSIYLTMIGLMKREKIGEIFNEIKAKVPNIVKESLKLWPAVHCVTYGILNGPLFKFRILWCDTIEIIWVAILSNKAAAARKAGDADADAAVSPA